MSFKGNDMLLRVLAEGIKKEKLEEKAQVVQLTDVDNIPTNANKTDIIKRLMRRGSNIFGSKTSLKNKTSKEELVALVDLVKDIAAIEDPNNTFGMSDFIKAYSVEGTEDERKKIESASKYFSRKGKEYIQQIQNIWNSIEAGDPSADTEQAKQEMASLTQDLFSKVDIAPSEEFFDEFGTPDIARGVSSSATFSNGSGDDFKEYSGFTKTTEGILSLFQAVDGKGLMGKLKTLEKFGNKIKDDQNLKKDLESMSAQDQFKFMNTAAAYLALADLGKQYDGVSAGLAFEKYLAVMFNMPVAGGSNGAADNVATLRTQVNPPVDNTVYFSAKLYKDGGLASVEQSLSTDQGQGILALVKNSGKSVMYITVGKKRQVSDQADAQYNQLNVYITSIFWDEDEEKYKGKLYEQKGDDSASVVLTYDIGVTSSKVALFGDNVRDFARTRPTFVIQAPTIDADNYGMTTTYLSNATKDVSAKVIESIKKAYRNSQKIEDSVRGYSAKKTSGQGAVQFVTNLQKSFNDIFFNLKEIITQGEGATTTDKLSDDEKKAGKAFKGDGFDFKKGGVSESRQIADVIKEMKEKELKKR